MENRFGSHTFQASSTTIYVSLSSIRVLQGILFRLGEASEGLQSNLLFKAEPEIGSDQLFRALSSWVLKSARDSDCTACSTSWLSSWWNGFLFSLYHFTSVECFQYLYAVLYNTKNYYQWSKSES